ncbi:MAG: hypothetical protein FWG02_03145 [Holophagaceae bacterium]|nr:hypothetical protein [Holophagaceae bacterium]
MKRPVWQFEIIRDTNAPLKIIRESLLNGRGYGLWHPRHKSVEPEIISDGEYLEIKYNILGCCVSEEAWYRVELMGERILLTYRNKFKGWPVLFLMGWWRIRSENIWDRFIASLE